MKTFKRLKTEIVYDDDVRTHHAYLYIVDGVFTRNDAGYQSVGEWKAATSAKEIRRCDMFSHPGACLGDRVTETGE